MTYILPMSKLIDPDTIEQNVPVDVVNKDHMCIVNAKESGYRTKYFVKDYFDWLIYTGYIKIAGEV